MSSFFIKQFCCLDLTGQSIGITWIPRGVWFYLRFVIRTRKVWLMRLNSISDNSLTIILRTGGWAVYFIYTICVLFIQFNSLLLNLLSIKSMSFA